MDITTVFLAAVWGPVILAVAIGIFASRRNYVHVYRDLEKAPLAVLLFGMVAMSVGIVQVLAHNMWGTLPEILVSLLGWGLLLKGAAFIVAPRFVDRSGDRAASSGLLNLVGTAMLVLGAYFTWLAYLA